jgi:magnesium transporter
MGCVSFLWFKNIWLSLILWMSMTVNLVIAGVFGSMVPLILRKCKLDPALGSSIFVTTATDVFGFFIFLGLSTLLLAKLVAA